MAYVPDKAVDHEDDVSPAAGRLFRYYCKWRDHLTRLSRKGFARAVEELKLPRATAYRAQKQLIDEHWIRLTADGYVMPVMGSFKPVDKLCDDHWREWQAGGLKGQKKPCLKNETGAFACLKNETKNLNRETDNLKNETKNLKNETGSHNDRARASSRSSSPSSSRSSSPPHTHDLESQPARASADEGEGGVCVCSTPHGSKICDAERIRIAQNMPTVKWAEQYAQSDKVRDGRDDLILLKRQAELRKPGGVVAPLDTTKCPDCAGKGMYYPQGPAKGVKKCHHERLFDAGDLSPPVQSAAARSP